MKKIIFILVGFIFSYNLMLSAEPKLLWSNEDTGISKILFAKTSISGDTMLIVEKHCIRLYDTKSFNLLRKVEMNTLKSTTQFNYFESIMESMFNVNLPYILYGKYLINIDSNSYKHLPINAGYYLDQKTNISYVILNDWVFGGHGEQTYYGDLYELDFHAGKVKSIKEFRNDVLRNAYKIGNKFFFLTDLGLSSYDTVTLETKFLIYDTSLRYLSDNYTESDNFIHIFRNRNFIEYISINKNDLSIKRDTINNKIFQNKDAVLNIYAKSASNNPGIIFVNFSYLLNEGRSDSLRKYAITVFDLEKNKILFEFEFDSPSISINMKDGNLNYYVEKVLTNDSLFTNTEIRKLDVASKNVNLSKTYKQLIQKNFKYQYGEMNCFFENKIQKWDEYTGNIISNDTYNSEIQTIHKNNGYSGNFILFKDNSLKHTNYKDFIDYPLISTIDAETFLVTPDHKNILFFNGLHLFVSDPNTLQIKNRYPYSNQPMNILDDSVIVILNIQNYADSNMILMNINTGNRLNLPKKVVGYNKMIKGKTQNTFLGVGNKNLYKISVYNKAHTDTLIYQHSEKINNASESFDGKYFAIIAIKNQNSSNIDNDLIIIDAERDTISSRIYSVSNEPITDLAFSNDKLLLYYTTYNFKTGLIQLIKYDIQNKVELQRKTFSGIVFANFDKSNFILKSNFFELDDHANILLNYVKNSSIIINPDDFSVIKTLDFTNNYLENLKISTKNQEVIYQHYLYKTGKNLLLTQETRTVSTPQIISIYDINTDKLNSRIFKYGSNTSFYNNKPNYFMIYDGMKLTINPFDFNFKVDCKINLYNRYIQGLISPSDSKILIHDYSDPKFRVVDLNTGIESTAFKEDGFSLNSYEFLYNDSILFIARYNKLTFFDIYLGQKLFETYLTHENGTYDFKVSDVEFFKNQRDYITSHFDGTIRFWRANQSKFTSKMIIKGSYPTSIFLFDDDKKLFVNTSDGYVYCYDIEEHIKSNIFENNFIKESVGISPNPATDFITINLDRCATLQKCGTSAVEIYDMMGIQIQTTPSASQPPLHVGNLRIDVSHLPTGVYFVKFGGRVQKFVKM